MSHVPRSFRIAFTRILLYHYALAYTRQAYSSLKYIFYKHRTHGTHSVNIQNK